MFSAIVIALRFVVFLVACLSIAGAHFVRAAATSMRTAEVTPAPYTPSPDSAGIVSLGYRELAADILLVELTGYFAATDSSPRDSAALAEAIVALDPRVRRAYEFGALAMTDARREPDHALQLRAIDLLERGMREFPDYWRFPNLAGSIYVGDLHSDDPAERRAWDDKGSLLIEAASRKPGAPRDLALTAAIMQTKLGQKERAIASLKEMLLITTDPSAREALLAELAKVSTQQSEELAAEILGARRDFERQWKSTRGSVPATFYLLIGPPLGTAFDLGDLAAGGAIVGTEGFEQLEPLTP